MCFTRQVLKSVPHQAFSIVEDVEYGIRLGEAGYRVHYADEAHVYGEMVSTGGAARSQRQRWEGGRRALARAHGMRLLGKAWAQRDPVLLDLAVDVLIPPLSILSSASLVGLVLASAGGALGGGFGLSRLLFGSSSAALAAYVLRGWMLSGTGLHGLLTLAASPAYVLWKMAVRREAAQAQSEWVRTKREQEPEKSAAS
jgi:cellulose synthase/poly-beta-1,6-N-acetylglucosamine synthase-like glycosyltransferase